MTSVKYLFFDLDGTLKGRSRRLTPGNKAALLEVQEAGHKIFLCSGRSTEFLRRSICLEFPFDGVVGCAGGSVFVDGRCIYENSIPEERMGELFALFSRLHMDYALETTTAVYQTPGLANMMKSFGEMMAQKDPKAAEESRKEEETGVNRPMAEYEAAPRSVQKICFICYSPQVLETFTGNAEKDFHIVYFVKMPQMTFGEIIPKSCTKARGIQAVLDHYGASREDSIGFGDSMNDYQMMEYVATKVVYENAPEKLRALADCCFTDPDQDGIAGALELLHIRQ